MPKHRPRQTKAWVVIGFHKWARIEVYIPKRFLGIHKKQERVKRHRIFMQTHLETHLQFGIGIDVVQVQAQFRTRNEVIVFVDCEVGNVL